MYVIITYYMWCRVIAVLNTNIPYMTPLYYILEYNIEAMYTIFYYIYSFMLYVV